MRAKKNYNHLRICPAAILCVILFSAAGLADTGDFSVKEIFSKSRSEPGEAFYFFIPQTADDNNQYSYVYDTKLDRLLSFPKQLDLITHITDRDMKPEDLPGLLSKILLNNDPNVHKDGLEDWPRLKVIELDEKWVKFTLGGRHIVLPRRFMAEGWGEKNFPLGREIVNKDVALPEDYAPDDLVRINQKWNFHTSDCPKYLRRPVARIIERMLQNAEEQGVYIRVFSAYRSYAKQRFLHLNAVSRYGPNQNRVAKQGHSEHQLGTTVDLCGLGPKSVLNPDFDLTKEGRWLREHARKYGFCRSYTTDNQHLTGYIPEPWHYRFYGSRWHDPAKLSQTHRPFDRVEKFLIASFPNQRPM